MAATVKKKRT